MQIHIMATVKFLCCVMQKVTHCHNNKIASFKLKA